MKNLNEAFIVDRGKDRNGNIIAYINPNKPENKESFKFKDVFKDHKAKWDGQNKFWYWYIGKTEDQWKAQYERFIKPALEAVHKAEGAPEEDANKALIDSLNTIISAVESTPIAANSEVKISAEDEQNIKNRLQLFKQKLTNIENDEDFKQTMSIITKFKNAQGYKFSFGNAILIYIQNPNATIVNNKTNWQNIYHRTVNSDAKPLMVYAPQTAGASAGKAGDKNQKTAEFLKAVNKTSPDQLSPNEKIRLQSALRGFQYATRFKFVPVYDVKDTTQMEGTEDHIKGTEEYEKIKWSDENNIDDKVSPIYNGLKKYAESLGIPVEMADDLNGAKGVSKNGRISVLTNKGNDVGLTKTLAHELAHEFLHQSYAKSKDASLGQYFIGKEQGRQAVEQQAEIAAWMIMDAFGYDMKTSSLNYALLWGANKDSMVKVFDTVANAVNKIIDGIKTHSGTAAPAQAEQPAAEVAENTAPEGDHVDGFDVAKFLGVEDQYKEATQHKQLQESFYRFVKYKING